MILNKEDLGLRVTPPEAADDLALSGRSDAKVRAFFTREIL